MNRLSGLVLASSPPPLVHQNAPTNINSLGDPILVLIFEQLPLEDLLQLGNVCVQWQRAAEIACRSRKSLYLMGACSKYTTVLLNARYGLPYDTFNCYRLSWADLNRDLCRSLSQTLPNITRLEFSGHSDQNTFYFLGHLFGDETWFPKLTQLKVLIGPLSYAANDEDDHEFVSRIQSHFESWNDLLEDLNFAQFAKQLTHLTLYNANILRNFRNIPLNIEENFTNYASLRELIFGVQCENLVDIIAATKGMAHLRKFILFDDDAHVSQERSIIEDLYTLEPAALQHFEEACMVYTDAQIENNLAVLELLSTRCSALTELHVYVSKIASSDLLRCLPRLEHLRTLRLSGFPSAYFSKAPSSESGGPPVIFSLTTLHLNCTRVITYSQLAPLVESCFPNCTLIQQNCLSGLYFMDDFLFPEEDPYLDDSKGRLVVMSPAKRIKAERDRNNQNCACSVSRYRRNSLLNVQLESASLLVLEQLLPLLGRHEPLKHLRLEAPADNFAFFGENLLALPPATEHELSRLRCLSTLHLDCSVTGGQLPCPDKFPLTAAYWPNLRLLKVDGIRAMPGAFQLTSAERDFLTSLKPTLPQLHKVLLIKDCSMPRRSVVQGERENDDADGWTSVNQTVNFYSVQFLLHKEGDSREVTEERKESKTRRPSRLHLMVGQKITF